MDHSFLHNFILLQDFLGLFFRPIFFLIFFLHIPFREAIKIKNPLKSGIWPNWGEGGLGGYSIQKEKFGI